MKFNYTNLSDTDFEILSKDILQRIVGTSLRTYAKGRDGGIDFKGFLNNDIVGQSKNYLKTPFSGLKSSLKKEIPKVNLLNPKNYYIVTSSELSSQNIDDLYNMFKEYMKDTSHIIDLTYIDHYLDDPKNKDILLRHPKLWFSSHQLLLDVLKARNLFDSKNLLDEITFESESFVRTHCFWESLELIKATNIVLLIGDAGVGKTTNSKLILQLFSVQGFNVVYNSGNDYDRLREQLSLNPDKKEIIFVDDFLGQRYLELNEKIISPLNHLINYIRRSSNKKMIINSRVTILNEARNSFVSLNRALYQNETSEYEINMNKISDYEKAMILFMTCVKFKVPKKLYNTLKVSKRYKIIVSHKNYTPRTIEYFCSHHNEFTESDYYSFIVQTLNNAYEVWDNEFSHKISLVDRVFVLILYSLGNKLIPESIFIETLNKFLVSKTMLDGNYEDIAKRLENSFISIIIKGDKRFLTLKNPSVYDYLDKKIQLSYSIIDSIISNASYLDQISNILNILSIRSTTIVNLVDDIFNLENFTPYHDLDFRSRQYDLIYKYKIKDMKYQKRFDYDYINKNVFEKDVSGLYATLTSMEMVEFYGLNIYKEVDSFIKYFEKADCQIFIQGLKIIDDYYYNNETDYTKIFIEFETKLDTYIDDIIDEIFDRYTDADDIINNVTIPGDFHEYSPSVMEEQDICTEFEEYLLEALRDNLGLDYLCYLDKIFEVFEKFDFKVKIGQHSGYLMERFSEKIISIMEDDIYDDSNHDDVFDYKDEDTVDSVFEQDYPID